MAIITLLTDFGGRDPFVGIVKGVLLGIAPRATVVDICHDLDPGDVTAGALALAAAVPYFPAGTIHVAVVDPGVGGLRRALAVRVGQSILIGPDNGLLGGVLGGRRPADAVVLAEERFQLSRSSETFHGRDVFAPAAAHLVCGVPLSELGPPARELILDPPWPRCREDGGGSVRGEVIAIDRFGNGLTNIPLREPRGEARLGSAGAFLRVADHYRAAPPGESLAVLGSSGYLEVSICEGSAREELHLERGTPVTWRPRVR